MSDPNNVAQGGGAADPGAQPPVPPPVPVVNAGGGSQQQPDDASQVQASVASNHTRNSLPPVVPNLRDLAIRPQLTTSGPRNVSGTAADAGKAKYNKLLSRATPVPPEDLDEIEVKCPKSLRGSLDKGSNEVKTYRYTYAVATAALEHKFGVASYHVTGTDDAEDGDQTKPQYIQEQYVANLTKISDANRRIVEYDMRVPLEVPVGIRDRFATDPAEIFEYEQVYLLESWDKVDWETVCLWQWACNVYMEDEDRTSSKWLKAMMYESCTVELRELISSEYDNLDPAFKGGVTYTWLLCTKLFNKNRDTTAALKKFLKLWESKGLRRFKGENVTLARKQLLAVCTRLDEAGCLDDEALEEILTGFTLCSVSDFSDLFKSFLQDAKKLSLQSVYRHSPGVGVLAEIKVVLANAASRYDSLCLSNQWHVPKNHRLHNITGGGGGGSADNTCWNCEKPNCNVRICKEPRNDKKIEANRRKFYERKRANGGGSGGGSGGGDRKGGGGIKQQEREKWSNPKDNSKSLVTVIDGVPHAYCSGKKPDGTPCGRNTTHSTKYHPMWLADPQNFDLAKVSPNHGLVAAWKVHGGGSSGQRGGSGAPAVPAGGMNNATIRAKLSMIEDGVEGEEARAVIQAMKSVFLN